MSSLKYNVKINNDFIDVIKKTNFNINVDDDIIIINLTKNLSPYYENVSSTANALATLIEYDIIDYRCSRLFFNYNCESLNDAINNLINNGFCSYDDYNTESNDINEPPSFEIYNIAKEQKFTFDIIKLNKDLNSLFLSIINNEPFIISIRIYESFEYPETINTGFIPMPKKNEAELGGITIVIFGFNKQQQTFTAKYQNKFITLPFFYLIKDNLSSDCYIFILRNFNINIKTNKEEFKEFKIDNDNDNLNNNFEIIEPYIDLRSKFPEVYDQGKIGSCTANSLCSIFDYDSSNFKSSRLFLYYNERLINKQTNVDEGASIRDGIFCLKNYGICSEKDWAYIITNIFVKPSDICYENAKKNFVIEAFYISNDINTIKYWISKNEPISLGINVYSNFMNASKNGIVDIPLKTDEYLGGHAVIICGYDDINKRCILRNSWGSHWGDNGYFYLPYDYITNDDLCGDLWVITKSKFEN
jgi:C1A family cysteine protease